MTYTKPCEIQGTIYVKRLIGRLGPVTDIRGNKWDINGIFCRDGKQSVWAVPMSGLHPSYYDTSGSIYSGLIRQEWKPYLVEVKTEEQSESEC